MKPDLCFAAPSPKGRGSGVSAKPTLDEKSTMFRKQQRPAVGRKYKPMIERENS